MTDREKVISNIEQQIRWIEEIECHKFPGWLNVTNAMREALALLKEQEETIKRYEHFIGKMMDPDAENQACPPPPKV